MVAIVSLATVAIVSLATAINVLNYPHVPVICSIERNSHGCASALDYWIKPLTLGSSFFLGWIMSFLGGVAFWTLEVNCLHIIQSQILLMAYFYQIIFEWWGSRLQDAYH